jgi:NAD+ dependent glucose-6-phosphate dehydrogenase
MPRKRRGATSGMVTSMSKRVLVTGSTGNLGRKAVLRLTEVEDLQVTQISRNSGGDPNVIVANLETYDESWAKTFAGIDAVVHLAADPRPIGSWESIARLNIDLALNVFRAAEEAHVPRFVFGSSNWVLGGYRFRQERLTGSLPPRPINPYGASKLLIERYGRLVAARTKMTVLVLRIGYCQPGENCPGPHLAFGRWGQEMWLGNFDWAQAIEKSVCAPFSGFAVLNIVSRNAGMRWDLAESRAAIGYEPAQSHIPQQSLVNRFKDWGARLRETITPTGGETPTFGARW